MECPSVSMVISLVASCFAEKDKVITANTKITEGYDTSTSSVMKEEDKVNETSTTVVEVKVIGENDDSAKQLATNLPSSLLSLSSSIKAFSSPSC
jgi:organic hydroperoxide reductase OsmC/OhrA